MMNMVNDMQLRQYIDQVFMRYDTNNTGTLNLPELHIFLNELFQLCGYNRIVTYQEAYAALLQVDANRDGHVNKYELFNLFRYLTQPGFSPLPYNNGNYSFGMGGVGVPIGYTETYSSTTTTTTYPATTYTTNVGGAGDWTNSWGGW